LAFLLYLQIQPSFFDYITKEADIAIRFYILV